MKKRTKRKRKREKEKKKNPIKRKALQKILS